uniref:Aminotransferase-like plant mobile domain-containing protein n=1 Tax=Chenopodium quinoa TaxID=63459 RepID=A0A803LYD9_CHEQI
MEHVGFLAFWLSMFVFPVIDDGSVGSHGFPVAIRLAKGARIALAPAVLACLYQNMSFLTMHAADFDSAKKEVSVPGPFQILQLWAFERFPLSIDLDVGRILSGYSGDVDDELKAFQVCLLPQELIGIDRTATCQPHRVMMQFECGQSGHKVKVDAVLTSPLKSGNVRLLNGKKPSEVGDNIPREGSISAHEKAVIEGLEQVCKNDDHKRPILTCDEKTESNCNEGSDSLEPAATVSPVSEILNLSGGETGDNGTKDKVQSLEGLVVMDSDDEMAEKAEFKEVIRSRSSTKKLKRRIGDSADYPLFINEYSNAKKVKKSGIFGSPIDVENYWL